jgi:cytochrome c-type biogenesis protein CcmE
MRRRDQRLVVIAVAGALVALAATLMLVGFRDSVVYFYAPSELAAKARAGENVRIGGLVEQGSVARDGHGALLFTVTDGSARVRVRYPGQPPDLFREGQGVVVDGIYQPNATFTAQTLLARHDERYMPREVERALKARGEWKGAD